MKPLLACLLAMMLVIGSAAQAGAQELFSEIIVFGDSLSDTGNVPPQPPEHEVGWTSHVLIGVGVRW